MRTIFGLFVLFSIVIDFIGVEQRASLIQYLPSVDEKKENRHPFRPRCLFKRIPTKSSNADAKIREK